MASKPLVAWCDPIPANPEPSLTKATRWFNGTDRTIRLELYIGIDHYSKVVPAPGRAGHRPPTLEERTGVHVVEIPSKSHVDLPSSFDRAIHDVRNGVIVGGLGTALKRVVSMEGDVAETPVHSALVANRAASAFATSPGDASDDAAFLARARGAK